MLDFSIAEPDGSMQMLRLLSHGDTGTGTFGNSWRVGLQRERRLMTDLSPKLEGLGRICGSALQK